MYNDVNYRTYIPPISISDSASRLNKLYTIYSIKHGSLGPIELSRNEPIEIRTFNR